MPAARALGRWHPPNPTQDPRASPLPHPGQHGYPGEGRTATKVTAGTVKKTGHMVKGMAEVCVHMCGSAFRCVCAGMPDVCTVYVHTCVQACRGVHVCVCLHVSTWRHVGCVHTRVDVSAHVPGCSCESVQPCGVCAHVSMCRCAGCVLTCIDGCLCVQACGVGVCSCEHCRCAQCVYAYVDVCSQVSVSAHTSVCRVCVHTREWVLTGERGCSHERVQGMCTHT